jgi:hypothetical protein
MPKFDSTTDRQYPEQVDKNLICDRERDGFAFPPRASISMTHLLARANSEDLRRYECVVIGVDKESGQKFMSTTLDPVATAKIFDYMIREIVIAELLGTEHGWLKDADPDSSLRNNRNDKQ